MTVSKQLITIDPIREQIKQKLIEKYDTTIFMNTNAIDLKVDIRELLEEYIAEKDIKTPQVFITTNAYVKMRKLVETNSMEIGWYGTVERQPGLNNVYVITDIIVYPQLVSGITCTQDEDKLFDFEMSLTTEQVNTKRFHGHSHVNMATGPSGVDEQFYQDLLTQVNDFFIILVTNKKNENTIRFYDKENNIIYNNIEINILNEDGTLLDDWLDETKEVVRTKASIVPPAKQTSIFNDYDDDFYDSYFFANKYYESLQNNNKNKNKYKKGK